MVEKELVDREEIEKILESRRDFVKQRLNANRTYGSFKAKKIRYLGPHFSSKPPDPNATSLEIEKKIAKVRREIKEFGRRTVPEARLKPYNWRVFTWGVPGSSIALSVVQEGMRFVFAKEGPAPPVREVSEMRELKGNALLIQLSDCLKWLKLGRFTGPWPADTRVINGKCILLANTFCVPKPPKDDGTPQWRSILDGSFLSPHFEHTAVLYPRHKEIAALLTRINFAWKADIKGGYKNFLRA